LKRKAQIGVEFFLVLSVIMAFIIILYGTASNEIGKTKILNDAVVSKAGVDSLSQAIDFVFLSGSGSVLTKELFVSPNSNCFYLNSSLNRLYCTVSSEFLNITKGERVLGSPLLTPSSKIVLSGCSPVSAGWIDAVVENTGANVSVSCTQAGS
jgi:hypothetical protein